MDASLDLHRLDILLNDLARLLAGLAARGRHHARFLLLVKCEPPRVRPAPMSSVNLSAC